MPEINNIYIDDPKRLSEPIKTIEVSIDSIKVILVQYEHSHFHKFFPFLSH